MLRWMLPFRYSIGDCIGHRFKVHKMHRGGFSEVYLCMDLDRNSWPVALKTPRPDYLTDRGVVKSFQIEAERWVALGQHPNIVTCHLLTTFDNISFIVLDWIENDHPEPSLKWRVLNGQHTLKLAVRAVVGACRGLIHAERLIPGIVHGDIKPENILLTARDIPKLTDFGSSQIFGRQTSEARGVYRPVVFEYTSVSSTRKYAAPEMRNMLAAADCRADVYALGCVLVETCIGHAADGDWADHLNALQPALRAVAARCLMTDPNDRYQTVKELCADLEALGLVEQGSGDVTPDESARALDNLVNLGITQFAVGHYGAALESFTEALSRRFLQSTTFTCRTSSTCWSVIKMPCETRRAPYGWLQICLRRGPHGEWPTRHSDRRRTRSPHFPRLSKWSHGTRRP